MPLDQVANFISVDVQGGHTSGDSTIQLQSEEASRLPDVSNGKYNLVWFDDDNFRRPDKDPNAEIVRVNSINTSNDTVSVTRGVENTTATSKNATEGKYELLLGVTAKTITDIDTQKLDESAYSPESDTHSKTTSASELTDVSADSVSGAHHSRYTDSEASSAAPVQSVNSKTGNVSLPPTVNRVKTGKILIDSTGTETVSSIPFEPNEIQFHAESRTPQFNFNDQGRGGSDSRNYAGSTTGFARKDGASIAQQTIHSGGSGNSINQTGHYTSDSHCFAIRYSGQNGEFLGFTRGTLSSFNTDGFTLNVTEVDQPIVLLYTAYRTGAVTETLSEISHTGLTDISSNDHHSKTSSASELTDVSPDSVSGAHHSRYSNEEAQDAVGGIVNDGLQYDDANDLINVLAGNALTIDTSGNIKVVESSISHDNISGVSSSDHHSKTSSASELTDVSPDSASSAHHSKTSSASELTDVSADSVSNAHHSKTSSASELTDVSPDSKSNAHHSRYSNEEAQDAVGSIVNDGLQYDDANDLINVLAGNALTIDTSGNIKVVESSISHDNISGVSSSDHHSKTSSASELTDVSPDSVSGAHHSRYSDSEARTAVDGANVSITGDADTVDGFEATDLARPKNIAVLTSTDTSTDINTGSNVSIPFDKELQVDAGFSHSNSTNPDELTFDDAGTYKIIASLSFSGGGSRSNPNVRLSLNGTILEPRGASGYMRNREGHDEASSDVFEVLTVNSGDTLRVETIASADTGTVTLRANESRLIVEQVSETVARSGDADTVDGSHAADFASDNHDNTQHSTNFLPESQKTSSASELTDVSADSVSGAHHSRYSNSEAVTAVENQSSISTTLSTSSLNIDANLIENNKVTISENNNNELTVTHNSSGVTLVVDESKAISELSTSKWE